MSCLRLCRDAALPDSARCRAADAVQAMGAVWAAQDCAQSARRQGNGARAVLSLPPLPFPRPPHTHPICLPILPVPPPNPTPTHTILAPHFFLCPSCLSAACRPALAHLLHAELEHEAVSVCIDACVFVLYCAVMISIVRARFCLLASHFFGVPPARLSAACRFPLTHLHCMPSSSTRVPLPFAGTRVFRTVLQ